MGAPETADLPGGGLLGTRRARRRALAYALLLVATLLLMASSSAPAAQEFQHGLAFALRPAQTALQEAAGTVSTVVTVLGEIDRLRGENEALRAENERLREENGRLQALQAENDQLTALLQLQRGLDHVTVAARVIGRESADFRQLAVVDRGSRDGVQVGDVVVAAGGALAGRVVDVGTTYADVVLISDPSSVVIGRLVGSGATGEVVGQLEGALVMRNIDATVRIALGEEVVTAGLELANGIRSPYPKGLLIGQIVDVRRDANDVVQTAFLEPAAPLDTLQYVLVITDYQGGLPTPGPIPLPCPSGGTLPAGEEPCASPSPSS